MRDQPFRPMRFLPALLGLVLLGLPLSRALAVVDYTVNLSGSSPNITLTVTNVTNNGDTLTVAPAGTGTIQFSAPNRFFSFNGGAATSGSSAAVVLSSLGNVVVNTGSGAETINVSAFPSATFPTFTIFGGTGADTLNFTGSVTFGSGSALNVNLTKSSAGVVNVNNSALLNVGPNGSGPISIQCSQSVSITGGAVLQTADGNLTVMANQLTADQTTATTGNFNGVYLAGAGSAIKTTGGGNVAVSGTGGNDSGGGQIGVYVYNGGQIIGGPGDANANGGSVNVTGTGGASTGSINRGVTVYGTNSAITSQAPLATLTVKGTGGAHGSEYGIGVSVLYGGKISGSAQTDVMSVTGTGNGAAGTSNQGVEVAESGSLITAANFFSVTGTAGPLASNGTGVTVYHTAAITGNGLMGISADSVSLADTASISTTGSSSSVTFSPAGTATQLNVGASSSAGVLGLTQATLNHVSTPSLGFESNGGNLTIGSGITVSGSTSIYLGQYGDTAPIRATASGVDLTLGTGQVVLYGKLACPITGASADTGYPQLNVAGKVTLGVATLDLTGTTFLGAVGNVFTVLKNSGSGTTTSGTFTNLAEGAYLAWPPSTSFAAKISYVGGTGHDVTLTLYGAPTANPQSVTTAFNTNKQITLTGSDPNTPPLPLTYSITSGAAHGTVTGIAPNMAYAPNAGYHGADSFQFTVTNAAGLTSAPATVTVTVSPGTPTTNSQSIFVPLNTATAITLAATDPDSPALPLSYTATANPAHGTLSGTAPNLTYTPASSYTGADSFTFTVNNGTNTSSPATVSLTVGAFVVRNNAATGAGSLVDQINLAASHSGADTITFDPSLSGGIITLAAPTSGSYAITIADSAGVTLDASSLSGGLTIAGGGSSGGFGLFQVNSDSSLTLRGLTLKNGGGSAFASGSGYGGAISNDGTLMLVGCTLTGNSAAFGGAISSTGTLTLSQCTLSGNSASRSNGAIVNGLGSLTLVQCTLSGNSSIGGGAIGNGGSLTIAQCTLSANSTLAGSGAIDNEGGALTLTNSIVAGNTGGGGDVYSDVSFVVAGANVVQSILESTPTGSGTVINAAPVLAPLGSYGGPTQTMPPLPGSPAIDHGNTLSIPLDPATNIAFTTDQRGKPRISGVAVDIGAVETSGFIVRTAADDGSANSLRQLVTAANDISNTITFDPSLNGSTIPLNNIGVGLSLSANTAIDASALSGGITISGGGATRLFTVASNTIAVFTNLTLTGGNGAGTIFNGSGGAIYNSGGTITLNQCMLVGNAATGSGSVGGAFRQGVTGTLTLNRCTVANNTANATSGNAGGVAGGSGTLTLNQCTFFGNSTVGIGGAITMAAGGGILNVNQCTISGNQAGISGGGLNNAGTLTLTNTIVTGNTSPKGADINNAGTLTLGGANLVQVISGTAPTGSGTYSSAAPLLAPLGNYGGNTLTLALLQGSPALNAAVGSTFTTDQRGFPIVGTPDIGAYEAGTLNTNFNAYIYETLPAGTATAQYAATADYDGDGVSNYSEFLAQTNAADPTSYLRVTSLTRTNNTLNVGFPTVNGIIYSLDYSPDLVNWTHVQNVTLTGNGSPATFQYPMSGSRLFLRVRTGP